MNRKNLIRMADFIQTIPQQQFDMRDFKKTDDDCGTVACVVGHCTVLDTAENLERYMDCVRDMNFMDWSKDFTGISWREDAWSWCFGPGWAKTDNTPIGAAKRIVYMLKHGLPEDWGRQMCGEKPLCYLDINLQTPVSSKTL